ncbi:MAG: hypothetical protein HC836_16835 [Richelia sp. RM2_1_2]|nr:hypothetical protein [Richelia sp. RM2_1_2]
MSRSLWEILIPKTSNDGTVISPCVRHSWDEEIRKISGGLTVLSPVEGHWIAESGALFKEEMVPVRVLATPKEMEKIIDLTFVHYKQESVLAYELSKNYILKTNDSLKISGKFK